MLLLRLLLLALPVRAQDPPACIPSRAGMTACLGEKLCLCRADPGGQRIGRPAGLRWDCGALRPGCGVAQAGPPTADMPVTIMPLVQPSWGASAADPRLSPRSGAGAAPHGTR